MVWPKEAIIKLYVIGNGFDLWHGLPTRHEDFYEFAKEVLDVVEIYFPIDPGEHVCTWHDFENRLGTFNWKKFYRTHDNLDVASDDFKPSYVYSLEDDLKEQAATLVDAVQERFQDWVEEIDVCAASKRMEFDSGSRFITFNYTATLEKVYGIKDENVLHVHGLVDAGTLVFGHGVPIAEESQFDAESGESNRTVFSDAEGSAKYPLYAFKKQVENIIENNRETFSTLAEITEVVVIGHSLNDIDLPYFAEIAKNASSCTWEVYCYAASDWEHHPLQLIRCGVNRKHISTRPYSQSTQRI